MIFVDTNILIRFLMPPVTPQDEVMEERAHALLLEVHTGDMQATTSEVVLYELAWLLGSRDHFGLDPARVTDMIRSILNWPGWSFPDGDLAIYFRALDILESNPKLEFSDSIIAARAGRLGATLATFDRRLAQAYSGEVWE